MSKQKHLKHAEYVKDPDFNKICNTDTTCYSRPQKGPEEVCHNAKCVIKYDLTRMVCNNALLTPLAPLTSNITATKLGSSRKSKDSRLKLRNSEDSK